MRSSKTRLLSAFTWFRRINRAVNSDPAAKDNRAQLMSFQRLSLMASDVTRRAAAMQSSLPPRLDLSPEFWPRLTKSSANPQVLVIVGLFVRHAIRVRDRAPRFAACEIVLNKLR